MSCVVRRDTLEFVGCYENLMSCAVRSEGQAFLFTFSILTPVAFPWANTLLLLPYLICYENLMSCAVWS